MRRFFLALGVVTLCLGATPAVSLGQTGSYDENALRLEGVGGGVKIVRGAQGTVVGRIGLRSPDLANLVSSSPNAVAEAREFQHNYAPGSALVGLGLGTLGLAIGSANIHDINKLIPNTLTLVGMGLIVYGGKRLERAYTALSKSLWWYNRDLNK